MRVLLDRFADGVSGVLPVEALWAHGSLALGDFQPGRSDIDLVALVAAPVTGGQREELTRLHEALARAEPLARSLHCAYVARTHLAVISHEHVTWAHEELFERIVSPVTRRELAQGGLCLRGPAPDGVVPAVPDFELAEYIRGDLRDFYYPHTGQPELWLRDIWVDLGMLTLARAAVTLREGRLITKRAALEVLAELGAPADVVRDIYLRRYEDGQPMTEQWREERGLLARTFVRTGIERVLGEQHAHRPSTPQSPGP